MTDRIASIVSALLAPIAGGLRSCKEETTLAPFDFVGIERLMSHPLHALEQSPAHREGSAVLA
jgi:hypothetical protein